MPRIRAVLLASLLSALVLAQLAACSGGTYSSNPMIDLSGPHSPNLVSGGGGPASSVFPGGPSIDSVPVR